VLLISSWSDTCWERRIWRVDTFWFCYRIGGIYKELLGVSEVLNYGEWFDCCFYNCCLLYLQVKWETFVTSEDIMCGDQKDLAPSEMPGVSKLLLLINKYMKHFVWHVRWCSPWVPAAMEHWAGTVHYIWCFSPGVPQNLRILPVASKGFADWNQETGTKRYLRPWDAFSGLLVRPKCTCGQGTRSPRGPIAGGRGSLPATQEPIPHSQPLA